jgi:hypothetical protein
MANSAWCANDLTSCAVLLVLLQDAPTEAEMKLLDMLAAIIQNMVSKQQYYMHHPAGQLIALVQIIKLLCDVHHTLSIRLSSRHMHGQTLLIANMRL